MFFAGCYYANFSIFLSFHSYNSWYWACCSTSTHTHSFYIIKKKYIKQPIWLTWCVMKFQLNECNTLMTDTFCGIHKKSKQTRENPKEKKNYLIFWMNDWMNEEKKLTFIWNLSDLFYFLNLIFFFHTSLLRSLLAFAAFW